MYGRGEDDYFKDTGYPGLRSIVEAVPVEDLPNFPSPYASQQNAASRNQLLNPLDIDLSDQYENLPIYF